jgi:hypothetical protein
MKKGIQPVVSPDSLMLAGELSVELNRFAERGKRRTMSSKYGIKYGGNNIGCPLGDAGGDRNESF